MLDFSDPHIWWYLTRASAMIAWVLLTLTVVWGVLLKTRILRGADNPEWLKVIHRYLSGLALVMILIHIGTLLLDDFIDFGPADVLIPFASDFEPFALALGILAFYLLLAVSLSALASRWLPERVWKGIHFASYGVVALVAFHSGLVGTDVGTPWYTAISLILITTTVLVAIVRVVIAGRARPTPRKTTPMSPTTTPLAVPAGGGTFLARVVDRQDHGPDIAEFILTPLDSGCELEWEAGAHLTLHLPEGLERQYSLAGDPAEQHTLVLGVLNTHGPGGGSSWIHDNLKEGDTIVCSVGSNHFGLKPSPRYQFIASGIGITALRSMLFSLPAHREWSLIYVGRSRDRMLFSEELVHEYGDRITLWVTEESGSRPPLEDLIDPLAEVYACGSESLLERVEHSVAPRRLHLERFTPQKRSSTTNLNSFQVVAHQSGTKLQVTGSESVLDAIVSAGVPLAASCKRGVCGSCEVRVLEGTPEHLDSVMSDADKDDLGVMYPCVSRSLTPVLTLDI